MPNYSLRDIDPQTWSELTERANREGWPLHALIKKLIEGYAAGRLRPDGPPPKQLAQYAWLRPHYRALAKGPRFDELTAAQQWECLVAQVLNNQPAAWRTIDEVPIERRPEVLTWLRDTSDSTTRHVLTLRAIAHIGEGPDLQTNRRPFQFEVLGLPAGQQAWIADFNHGWRILRVIDGVQGDWTEGHMSKEDALDTLATVIDQPDHTLAPP